MQKTMFQFLPKRQGLINLYKLDKSHCVNTLQQKKGVAFHTQVGVVNPEHKQLKLDVSSGVCRVNHIQMLFKVLQTKPATSKVMCSVFLN